MLIERRGMLTCGLSGRLWRHVDGVAAGASKLLMCSSSYDPCSDIMASWHGVCQFVLVIGYPALHNLRLSRRVPITRTASSSFLFCVSLIACVPLFCPASPPSAISPLLPLTTLTHRPSQASSPLPGPLTSASIRASRATPCLFFQQPNWGAVESTCRLADLSLSQSQPLHPGES